jgi:pimeloyl-ACP methyl ester carboxylesterase
MTSEKFLSNTSDKLVFHGSFEKKSERSNVLLLLPKTKGPFGTKKFEKLIKDDFNLLEYDDVLTEKSGFFKTSGVISLEDKALAINIALKKWKGIKFHIICHSTGCGLGTFLAKNNVEDCESLILISPWNKKDEEFISLQKERVKNLENLQTIMYLKSEYNLLYSSEYIQKYKLQFNEYILNQKDKSFDIVNIEKRLKSIIDCNIGDELHKLKLPKLFINAFDDKLMKVYHGKKLQKLCTNSELITLNSGGHMLTETQTDELIVYIKRFLNSLGK